MLILCSGKYTSSAPWPRWLRKSLTRLLEEFVAFHGRNLRNQANANIVQDTLYLANIYFQWAGSELFAKYSTRLKKFLETEGRYHS